MNSVRAALDPQRMYNLTVEGAHTVFVGQGKWLVHHSGCTDWLYEICMTAHGWDRLLLCGWTKVDYDLVKQGGRVATQADGASVFVKQTERGYLVLIENEAGQVVSAMRKDFTAKEVQGLAQEYGWRYR